MLHKVTLAFCLSLVFALTVKAQEQSLWLAGMDMRLGMSQETIMKRVLKTCELSPLGDSKDSYMVLERRRGNDRQGILGGVIFKQGKLIYASKEWYDNNEGADYKLADALYSVMTEMEKRGETLLNMQIDNRRGPSFTEASITLNFSKRRVKILLFEYKGSKSVQVTEELGTI